MPRYRAGAWSFGNDEPPLFRPAAAMGSRHLARGSSLSARTGPPCEHVGCTPDTGTSIDHERQRPQHPTPMKILHVILLCAAAVAVPSATFAGATADAPARPPHHAMRPPPSPEMDAYHQRVMAIYDTDKNGTLDDTEREVLREDIASGVMQPPPRPHGHRRPPPEVLAKYDTDHDGTLSDAERAALEADIAAGKLPPPPHRAPPADEDNDCPAAPSPQS